MKMANDDRNSFEKKRERFLGELMCAIARNKVKLYVHTLLSVIVFFIMANSGGDSLLNLAILSGKLMKFKCEFEVKLSTFKEFLSNFFFYFAHRKSDLFPIFHASGNELYLRL